MRIDIHPDVVDSLPVKRRSQSRDAPAGLRKTLVEDVLYQQLLQSVYDAVLIADMGGEILDANVRAVDFFIASREELLKLSILDIISGATDSLLPLIVRNLKEERYTLIEAHCVRHDGSTFPAEIAVNEIQLSESGQLCFMIRDITVRQQTENALRHMVSKLQEHDRAKSMFVSNVSHELKTPLTSMMYAVGNMLDGSLGELSPNVRKYLDMLNDDCKRLMATVDDILDMGKIEAKKLVLSKVRIPMARLVRRTAESLRIQAEAKGLQMLIDLPDGAWFVDCDPQKIARVIINIIANSIKYTSEGRVEVRLSRPPANPGFIELHVEDTGIGIPREFLARVTERYFRVGDQVSGSGLGLSIAKELLQLHGGKVELISPPLGKSSGTLAVITVPQAPPPKIIVADDEAFVADELERQLARHGYEVIRASNGEEAIRAAVQCQPDVIILDIIMPVKDGCETFLELKTNDELRNIPVLMITGGTLNKTKYELINSFAVPLLSKPWREAELLNTIEDVMVAAKVLSRHDTAASPAVRME